MTRNVYAQVKGLRNLNTLSHTKLKQYIKLSFVCFKDYKYTWKLSYCYIFVQQKKQQAELKAVSKCRRFWNVKMSNLVPHRTLE